MSVLGSIVVCIMSPWLFNVYMDPVMKEVKMGMGRKGVRFQEEGKECRLQWSWFCLVRRRKT